MCISLHCIPFIWVHFICSSRMPSSGGNNPFGSFVKSGILRLPKHLSNNCFIYNIISIRGDPPIDLIHHMLIIVALNFSQLSKGLQMTNCDHFYRDPRFDRSMPQSVTNYPHERNGCDGQEGQVSRREDPVILTLGDDPLGPCHITPSKFGRVFWNHGHVDHWINFY